MSDGYEADSIPALLHLPESYWCLPSVNYTLHRFIEKARVAGSSTRNSR